MRLRRTTLRVLAAAVTAVVALWATRCAWVSRSSGTLGRNSATEEEPADAAPAVIGQGDATAAAVDVHPRSMPRIPAGTEIGQQAPAGWSHLVLHAVPSVAEGDTGKVSTIVARLASLFHLTVLAQVDKQPGVVPPRFELRRVAIGLALDVAGKEVIVSSETQEALGGDLNFMDRSALAENEASLDGARQVAGTPTMVVFDAAAVMWLDGEHRPALHRHAVLVSPADGRLAALVWLLEPDDEGPYRLVGDSLQSLPDGLHEDRALHVDAGKFVLGVPTKEAFALVRLPQGKQIPLTADLKKLAPSRFPSPRVATELERALREAIGWTGVNHAHEEP